MGVLIGAYGLSPAHFPPKHDETGHILRTGLDSGPALEGPETHRAFLLENSLFSVLSSTAESAPQAAVDHFASTDLVAASKDAQYKSCTARLQTNVCD